MALVDGVKHGWTLGTVALAVALAVGGAGCGDSTTTPTTSEGSSSTSTTATTAPTTGTTMTSEGPGGSDTQGMTDATGTTNSTDPTTSTTSTGPGTTVEPTSATGTTDNSTTSDPTSDSSTGGFGEMCGVADGDYGECEAILGVAFDGQACSVVSGCDCAPDCDLFFPDVLSCATTCAEAGECNPEKMVGEALANELELGSFCDQVDVCTPQELEQLLPELFPDLFNCEDGAVFPCSPQEPPCTVNWAGMVDEGLWEQLCAASLLPELDKIACVIFGP